ncbi:hypothetical protein [Streptomyces virginiae]
MSAKLIVYPPDEQGWRRVRYDASRSALRTARPMSGSSLPLPG